MQVEDHNKGMISLLSVSTRDSVDGVVQEHVSLYVVVAPVFVIRQVPGEMVRDRAFREPLPSWVMLM